MDDQKVKDAFLEYEELKIQEKELKDKLEILKPIITENIEEGQVIHGRCGKFTLKKRDKWTYSASTEALAEDLKSRQDSEKANGEPTSDPTYYPEYSADK